MRPRKLITPPGERQLAFETLGRQAGARLRRRQGGGVFGGVEEGEVGRACSIERRNICNDVIEASPVTKFGSRKSSDLAHGQTHGVLEDKAAWSFHPPPRDNLKRPSWPPSNPHDPAPSRTLRIQPGSTGRLDYGGELRGLWGKPRGVQRYEF
jgi:hypothetical protein